MEKGPKNTGIVVVFLFLICSCNSSKVEIKKLGNFVVIPAGEYELGAEKHKVNPKHKAQVKQFAISIYEVTNAEFDTFVRATGYKTLAERYKNAQVYAENLGEYEWERDTTAFWRFPDGIARGGIENKMNHPVTCITFIDMEAYCKWKKVRLPSLDEWEIASRANSLDRYFWGSNTEETKQYANLWHASDHKKEDHSDKYLFTSPAGSFKPNPWGLFDVYGNVFEMCSSMATAYGKDPHFSSARGGSWWCSRNSCNYFNSVDIGKIHKAASFSNMGFRVVKDL